MLTFPPHLLSHPHPIEKKGRTIYICIYIFNGQVTVSWVCLPLSISLLSLAPTTPFPPSLLHLHSPFVHVSGGRGKPLFSTLVFNANLGVLEGLALPGVKEVSGDGEKKALRLEKKRPKSFVGKQEKEQSAIINPLFDRKLRLSSGEWVSISTYYYHAHTRIVCRQHFASHSQRRLI